MGYRRVSTIDQSLDRQDFGPDVKVFEEKASGKDAKSRPALQAMLNYVREGDHVQVWSIDRLARNLRDLQEIVDGLIADGVSIEFMTERLTFQPKDEANEFQRFQLQLIGTFAEFERNISKRRQREGIAKAKKAGKFTGKKQQYDRREFDNLYRQGVSPTQAAKTLGCSVATAYNLHKELGYKTTRTIKSVKADTNNGTEEAAS